LPSEAIVQSNYSTIKQPYIRIDDEIHNLDFIELKLANLVNASVQGRVASVDEKLN